MNDKSLENIWRPNPQSLGNDTQILSHLLYAHYCSPNGFEYDVYDDSPQFISDEKSQDFNGKERAEAFIDQMKERHEHYITDNIFVTMGCDFTYMDAHLNYRNMDNLIEYINAHYGDKYEVVYSTPSDYVASIAKLNVKWPTKYDDMMPIYDGSGYWTGFFSSRANQKSYIRRLSHNFHASNQLYTLKVLDQSASVEDVQKLIDAKNVMLDRIGILQHHDAVTGTGTQAVADDYNWKISTGMDINNEVFNQQVAERIHQLTGMNSKDNFQ